MTRKLSNLLSSPLEALVDDIEEDDEEEVSDQEQKDGERVMDQYEFSAERSQEEILNQNMQQEYEEYQRSQQCLSIQPSHWYALVCITPPVFCIILTLTLTVF